VTDGADEAIWDVVVVGAGPAGCCAAWAAASATASVLLLEKAELPRYKTCGGGIIGLSRAALPPGVEPTFNDQVYAVEFTMNGRLRRVRRSREPLFGLVNRAEFDADLAAAAVRAGAVLRSGTAVTRVEAAAGEVRLILSNGGVVRARAVVGADGSASRVGGYVGVRLSQVDLGLEAEIPVPPQVAERWRGRVLLDWGPLPGSYAWVFPKGDSLTVGVICARGNGDGTRSYLRDFIARLGLASFRPAISSGHLTRCREADSPLARGRVLVAGDAAGLLEPWTREGISYAVRSGRLAGEAAARLAVRQVGVDVAVEGYRVAIEATLGAEMRAGRRLLAAFERRPAAFHGAIALVPPAWSAFARVVRGETTFGRLLRHRVPRAALRALSFSRIKNLSS
jgi:geranylgeranyl reductase family protein